MKKYFMFFIVFVIFMCPSFVLGKDISFGNIAIESNGEDSFLIPTNSIETTDGYVVIGRDNLFKAFIAKTDSNGQILWNYTTGLFYIFHDVVVGNDGNYVVAAACSDASHACLFKFNTNGELLWEVRYGNFSRGDSFNSIIKVSDGYIVAGIAYSENIPVDKAKGSADGIIAKYDENGNLLWEKIYGGSMVDKFSGMIATSDGGYLAYGTTRSSDIDGLNFNDQVDRKILVKYDSSFNILWQKEFVDAQSNSLDKIVEDDDGTLIMLGSKDPSTNQSDAFIYKLNSNGELIWRKTFVGNGDDALIDVVIEDDCYVVLGTTTSTDLFSENMSNATNTFSGIIVYDKDGWQLAMKVYESDGYDQFMSMNKIDEYKYHIFGIRAVPIDESAYNFYISSLTTEILYDVDGYETMHGTYELKQSGGKLVVIPKPNNGYEVDGVFVYESFGDENYLPYTKQGNEYHFNIDCDVSLSISFKYDSNYKKVRTFNNKWSIKDNKILKGDDVFFSLYSGLSSYKDGIITYNNTSYENNFVGKIKAHNSNGDLVKEKEIDDYFIFKIVEGGDYLYATAFTFEDNEVLLKLNSNFEIVSVKESNGSFNIFELLYGNIYGLDMVVFDQEKIYIVSNNGTSIFDTSLNLIDEVELDNDEICSVVVSHCIINSNNDSDETLYSFDEYDNKVVLGGRYYEDEENNYGFIKFYDENNFLFEKKFDASTVMNAKIVGNYVIAFVEKRDVEIVILDFAGNIVHTIYDNNISVDLMRLGTGFVARSFKHASTNNDVCEYYEECYVTSIEFYDFSPSILVTGEDDGRLSIPSDAKPGETVTVDVDNKFGYTFEGFKITDANGNVTIVNGKSFVMPDTAVQIEPIFSPIVNPDTGTFISISVVILSLIGLFSYYFLKRVKVKKFST